MTEFLNKLFTWYHENARDFPFRRTRDPYLIWLSEVIMQQTRIEQGVPYYNKFAKVFPCVHDLAGSSEEEVLKQWQGLGYYSRARHLHSTAREVVEKYAGRFPESYEGLRSLKGVGDYTAAAIASVCFELPHPVVDGNVIRFITRYFGIKGPVDKAMVKKEIMDVLMKLMSSNEGMQGRSDASGTDAWSPPGEDSVKARRRSEPANGSPGLGSEPLVGRSSSVAEEQPCIPEASTFATPGPDFATSLSRHFATLNGPGLFNQAMIEFGAMYCVPRNPDCRKCIFSDGCYALKYDLAGQLPVKKQQLALRPRYFNYLVIRVKETGGLYFRKRTANDIWKGLYEFPLIETTGPVSPEILISSPEWKRIFRKVSVDFISRSGDIKHLLSHQKIFAGFYGLEIGKPHDKLGILFHTDQIRELPVARIIEKFLENYLEIRR